jgi:hypothetical protein
VLAHASNAHVNKYINDLTDDLEGSRRLALELAQRAERAGGNDPEVLAFAAYSLLQCGSDLATVDGLIERARIASCYGHLGRHQEVRAVPGGFAPASPTELRWLNLFRDGSFQAILDEGLALAAGGAAST